MKSLLQKIILLLPYVLLLPHPVRGQGCCTVGASSFGGFEDGVQRVHTWSVGIGYQSNILTRAYQGTNKIDDPLRREADVRYVSIQAEYGLLNRLSILASLNYSDKTRELTIRTGSGSSAALRTASFRGTGLGDVLVLAKYSLLAPTIPDPTGIAVGVGASLPTGSYTDEQDGSQLSIDLQPGTGAASLLGWLLVSHGLPELGLQFFLTSTYRYAGTNFDGYRIGDEILMTMMAEKSISENYSGFIALRSRFASRDFANRRFLAGTGGTYHDIMPGIVYADGAVSVKLFGQLPVYRNVRGIQLALAYMVGFQITYSVE